MRQMNFHSESQRCGFVALSIGLPRPKAELRVVDKLRPMLLYHLLAVFQAVRKGDDKPVSTRCQELQILLAVRYAVAAALEAMSMVLYPASTAERSSSTMATRTTSVS